MGTFFTRLLIAGCSIICVPALADSAKSSALIGAWAVDVSRLPVPPEARPRSVKITFSQATSGGLSTRVDVTDAAGNRMFAESATALDGTASAVQGNLEADMAATTMPTPGVLVMNLARGGSPASTRIYAVSKDGKSMTETAAYFGPDGRPALRTNYFSRLQ